MPRPDVSPESESRSKNLFLDRKLVEVTEEFVKTKRRETFSSLVEKLLIRHFRSSGIKIPEHLQ